MQAVIYLVDGLNNLVTVGFLEDVTGHPHVPETGTEVVSVERTHAGLAEEIPQRRRMPI